MTVPLKNRRYRERNHLLIANEAVRRGGGCEDCGKPYVRGSFHWHHREDEIKEFKISTGQTASSPVLKAELKKCDLLCADCHRKRHNKKVKG